MGNLQGVREIKIPHFSIDSNKNRDIFWEHFTTKNTHSSSKCFKDIPNLCRSISSPNPISNAIFNIQQLEHFSNMSFATDIQVYFFQICAVVLLALGIWMMNDCTFVDELLRSRLYMDTGYIALITSCFVIFLAAFGCIGKLTFNVLVVSTL